MTSDDSEDANSRPIRENGQRHLGTFATPEEAALCYARHIGAERSAAELAQARVAVPRPLTADEARAAAVAEGRELLPSSGSESGYKGVVLHYGKYQARIEEKGNLRHLGTFATPEEAALCYARHVEAERAVPELAEARGERPRPLTADEARAAAAAEGLELVPSPSSETGYKGVAKKYGMYKARVVERGMQRHLGSFTTPEEAALCYARHVGVERSAAESAEARVALPQPLTADEARAAAAAEGLELVPSSYGETGFKGVSKHHGKYMGRIKENGKVCHLGFFATPEEAALCYARHAGAKRAAAEASVARGEGLQPLTLDEADEVRAVAAAEGLELVPSWTCETGFKGETKTNYKYKAHTTENGKMRHLGTFATPEEAALCYARHVRDLVDGWLIPGPRPSHRPPSEAPVPAPPTPCEVEQAEALTSMRDDQRQQQGSPSSLPAATTEHASRERLATAVAFAEVVLQGAVAFQPQLSAESGDDPGAARCVICLEALDLSAASSRGETACGHTPCCGNYFHKRCLSQWLQGSGQSDERLPIERIEKKCPMCRREQLVALLNLEERLVALPNLEEGLVAPLPNLEEQLVARALLPVPRAVAVVHSEAAASATTSKSGRKRRAVAVDGEAEAQARLRELEDELEEEEMLALETALGVKRVPSAAAFVAALKAWESPEERPEQPSAQNSALASEGRGKK